METENSEISVVIRAKSVQELIDKLHRLLGVYEANPSVKAQIEPKGETDFPEQIRNLLPEYNDHQHAAAMLTILYANHKGKERADESIVIAKAMLTRFPNLFLGKTSGEVSRGNVFAGKFLQKKKLINIEIANENGEYRLYWVD